MNPGYHKAREIAGSPFEIGVRYGESIKPEFSRIVAQYAEIYLKKHDPARVEVIREGMEGYLRDHAPTLIEEMAGIAEGSGVSFDDVFKHNLCSCIGATLSSEASVREAAHCTSIGFPNSNRGPLLGKNTDCRDPEMRGLSMFSLLEMRGLLTSIICSNTIAIQAIWLICCSMSSVVARMSARERGGFNPVRALSDMFSVRWPVYQVAFAMGIVQFAVLGIRKSQPDPAATARSPESPAAVMDTSQTDSPRVSFLDSLSQQAITTIFPASSPVDSL